jgi:hypothetical protein
LEENAKVTVYLQSYTKDSEQALTTGDRTTKATFYLKPQSDSEDDEDDTDESEDSTEVSPEIEVLYQKIISLLLQLIAQLNK